MLLLAAQFPSEYEKNQEQLGLHMISAHGGDSRVAWLSSLHIFFANIWEKTFTAKTSDERTSCYPVSGISPTSFVVCCHKQCEKALLFGPLLGLLSRITSKELADSSG